MESGPYVGVPLAVLNSPAFLSLSSNAKRLLFDLMAGCRFLRNGDICAARSVMRKRGWTSNSSLARALKELLDTGLIEMTRQGGLHQPSLYALGWIAIDECDGKLDVPRSVVPPNRWKTFVTNPQNNPPLTKGLIAPDARLQQPSNRASPRRGGLATGPMRAKSDGMVPRVEGTFHSCHVHANGDA